MQTLTLPSGPTVRYYNDLDEFPAERRSWLTRYQVEASELDTTPHGLAHRMQGIIQAYRTGKLAEGELGLQNLLFSFSAMREHYAPDQLSFGVLLHDVDGVAVTDFSPRGVGAITEALSRAGGYVHSHRE